MQLKLLRAMTRLQVIIISPPRGSDQIKYGEDKGENFKNCFNPRTVSILYIDSGHKNKVGDNSIAPFPSRNERGD